jgi:acyl-coenzyme A synthetase/AMP-(fatty) acid ligase
MAPLRWRPRFGPRSPSGPFTTASSLICSWACYLPGNILCVADSKGDSMLKSEDMLNLLTAPRPPGSTVAWRGGKSVSREEFLARIRAWGALLCAESGQRFALYIDDAIEFAAALFGAWYNGKMIYLPGDRLPGTCGDLRQNVDGYLGEFAPEWQPMVPLREKVTEGAEGREPLRPDFVGLMLFTSGSTGAAQAVSKTLAQMSAEVATLENKFGAMLGDADILTTVSHQHIYGLLFQVLWPLTAGRAIHARSFSSFEELTAGLPERDWVLISSPAHLKRLPEDPAWATTSNRLRAVFASGGPLPLEVAHQTDRLLDRIPIEVYGSSETGGIAWRQQRTGADALWTPLPGVTWRIDPHEDVLEIRSPHLANEEWFRTADRVLALGENRFLLKGRIDKIAKVEGKRISLSAIEARLTASPLVSDARVLVIEGRRQRIAAFIVLSVDGRHKLVEVGKLIFNRMLRDLLTDSVEPVGLPRVWRYLDALPVNSQGKTTYAELAALVENTLSRPTLPLQRLISKDARLAAFELTAPRDLLYFDGHFPARPILAGVVQVEWVIYFGRQCFDLPPLFRAIHALKFQRIIPPEMPFTIELGYEPARSALSFKIRSRLGSHASGRVIFGAADV